MSVDLWNEIVLRWESDADCAGLLESGGIDAVWLPSRNDRVEAACRAGGVATLPPEAVRLVPRDEAGTELAGVSVAIKTGLWPGAHPTSRGADGGFSAGASQRAWIDANGYLVAWTKALAPGRAPVLGYLPDSDAGIAKDQVIAYDSLELALIDAWSAGGNYILAPDAAFREALLRRDTNATAAWARMGATARWLKRQNGLFRQPPLSTVTLLVEPGEATAETAALMFRQSGSPELIAARRTPAPDPARRPFVVAAGINPPDAKLRDRLLAHATAGATLFTDAGGESPWWRASGVKRDRQFDDREFYTLGAGRIVAYRDAVVDPGDFALDVLDLAGERRPVRLWDAPAAIATVSQANGKAPVLRVVNYGSPTRADSMARIAGSWRTAELLRPDEPPVALRTYRRGKGTEVLLPPFRRLAVVVFG
jgi:hypothetical protein